MLLLFFFFKSSPKCLKSHVSNTEMLRNTANKLSCCCQNTGKQAIYMLAKHGSFWTWIIRTGSLHPPDQRSACLRSIFVTVSWFVCHFSVNRPPTLPPWRPLRSVIAGYTVTTRIISAVTVSLRCKQQLTRRRTGTWQPSRLTNNGWPPGNLRKVCSPRLNDKPHKFMLNQH